LINQSGGTGINLAHAPSFSDCKIRIQIQSVPVPNWTTLPIDAVTFIHETLVTQCAVEARNRQVA
jgi:hypothetical protein